MADASNLSRLLQGILAIALGSGGVIFLFVVANYGVEKFPNPWRSRILPWVYVVPALALVGAYLIGPTLRTVYLSFFGRRSQQFVGWDNYRFVFTDENMVIAFRNNLLWLVLVTGMSVALGLVIAVLIDRVAYEVIPKTLIFLPMAISFVGASVIWRFVYAYNAPGGEQIGLLNGLITSVGLEPVGWLVDKSVNNFALMAIMVWLQTGFCMVLLSSAVKGIPQDILEAARIDGANEFQIFWQIIIPMIRSTILVVATTVLVLVLKVFDIVFVMTNGNLDTHVVASVMIEQMFKFRHFGRGSAIAVVLLVAVVPVMVINIRRFRQQELDS